MLGEQVIQMSPPTGWVAPRTQSFDFSGVENPFDPHPEPPGRLRHFLPNWFNNRENLSDPDIGDGLSADSGAVGVTERHSPLSGVLVILPTWPLGLHVIIRKGTEGNARCLGCALGSLPCFERIDASLHPLPSLGSPVPGILKGHGSGGGAAEPHFTLSTAIPVNEEP